MQNIVWNFLSPTLAGLIIFSNIIEIIIIARLKEKLHLSMVYILNLSISDLLVGLVIAAIKIVYFAMQNNPQLIQNKALVEFYFLLVFLFLRLSLIVSVLNLTAITVDRILAVRKPLWYRKLKQKKAICVSIFLWVTAASVLAVYYCGIRFDWISQQSQTEYELLLFPIVTIPAAVILSLCYYFIVSKLNMQRRRLHNTGLILHETTGDKLITFSPVPSKQEHRRLKKEWKVIKLAISVVSAYLICWLPISIYGLLKACGVSYKNIEDTLFFVAIMNSFLDPILYLHHIRSEIAKFGRKILHRVACTEFHVESDLPSQTEIKFERSEIPLPLSIQNNATHT